MSRRRSSIGLAAAAAALAVATLAGPVSANHFTSFSTSLSGAEEAPGPGDPNGKGFITLDVYNTGTICYDVKLQGIAPVTIAHIHEAPAGSPGGVVVDLRPDLASRTGNMWTYCVSTTPEQAAEIIANPDDYYVNFHNAAYPGGALRGQLGD